MKALQRKMVWSLIVMVAGIVLFSLHLVRYGEFNSTASFAGAIIGVSVIKLIQLYRISKNPVLVKKFEIGQQEERTITIAEKSGRFTFLVTIITEFIAMFVLILFNKIEMSNIVSYVTAAQAIVYLMAYYYLTKKY